MKITKTNHHHSTTADRNVDKSIRTYCMEVFHQCGYTLFHTLRYLPRKLGQTTFLLLVVAGTILLSWIGNSILMSGMTYDSKQFHLYQQQYEEGHNRTIVFLMGNLRCGEAAWESLYQNVLDVNHADLGLVIRASDEAMYKNASLWKRATYVFRVNDHNDWENALGKF